MKTDPNEIAEKISKSKWFKLLQRGTSVLRLVRLLKLLGTNIS